MERATYERVPKSCARLEDECIVGRGLGLVGLPRVWRDRDDAPVVNEPVYKGGRGNET